MMVFDASNRDQCEVKRLETNTPLQALIMMNDPTVLEASRVLAERLVKESDDAETRVEKAFRLILARRMKESEKKTIMSYYTGQLAEFESGSLDIKSTLDIGEYRHITGIDQKTAAALMKTITLMYNLEETLSKA